MGDHLELTSHRTKADFDQRIRITFLGQAHFAGTGPEGKTCRECKFWHLLDADGAPYLPYYNSDTGELHRAKCHRPIAGKANRRIPHNALACRLFESSDCPKSAVKPDATKA